MEPSLGFATATTIATSREVLVGIRLNSHSGQRKKPGHFPTLAVNRIKASFDYREFLVRAGM